MAMETPLSVRGAMIAARAAQNAAVFVVMSVPNAAVLVAANPVVSAVGSAKKAANAEDSGVKADQKGVQSAVIAGDFAVMTAVSVVASVAMIDHAHHESAIATSLKLSSPRSTRMLSPSS